MTTQKQMRSDNGRSYYTQSQSVSASNAVAKHGHTPGSILFDASVYGGINYLVNGAISVGLAYYAMNKPSSVIGRGFSKTGEIYENFFLKFAKSSGSISEIAKSRDKAIDGAKFLNGNMWLGSGGFALLLPIKWIEDRKQQLVTYADEKLGSLPEDEKARKIYDDTLADAPQQTNTSLWLGRIGSFAATCAAGSMLKGITRPVRHRMTNYFKGDVGFLDAVAGNKSLLKSITQDDASAGRLLSDEIVLCAIGATLLYGTSKAIASYNHYYRDGREAAKEREAERKAELTLERSTPSAHQVDVAELIGQLEQPKELAAARA